jgi:hypothetical protein
VFRTAEGRWSLALADADVTADGLSLAAAEADAARQIIVEPYAIDVDVKGPVPRPVKLREAIRASGPTIAYGPAALLEAAE